MRSKQNSTMRLIPCLLAIVLLAGCSTPDSRIAKAQSPFDRLPAEAREKIRAGQVDVGFTPEMVRLALGEPDRVYLRQSDQGETEVWGYRDRGHVSVSGSVWAQEAGAPRSAAAWPCPPGAMTGRKKCGWSSATGGSQWWTS